MGTTGVGVLIIGGGLLVVVVVVVLLVSSQRRRPAGGGWYAGRATGRRVVPEDFYDLVDDPDYVGDRLPGPTDSVLRGDLAPPRSSDGPTHPPAGPGGA